MGILSYPCPAPKCELRRAFYLLPQRCGAQTVTGCALNSAVPLLRSPAACFSCRHDGAPGVAITGEIDLNSALAQLANARYAPESLNSGGRRGLNRHGGETLAVLTSLAEVRAAVNEIAATAQRLISIYTPDLEPDLYDQSAFLEVIKHFVLTRSFAKVRVLLAEPTRVMRDSNRFVAMGRRLSSCIDIRYVAASRRSAPPPTSSPMTGPSSTACVPTPGTGWPTSTIRPPRVCTCRSLIRCGTPAQPSTDCAPPVAADTTP